MKSRHEEGAPQIAELLLQVVKSHSTLCMPITVDGKVRAACGVGTEDKEKPESVSVNPNDGQGNTYVGISRPPGGPG